MNTFSPDYFTARRSFLETATAARARLESFAIPARWKGEELTTDAALFGSTRPRRAVLVTSGVHGTEGFFGSAVQLSLLEQSLRDRSLPDDVAVIVVHAINPFGFAARRRANEDNVDLNRNFLLPGEPFAGSPPLTAQLRAAFNPHSPPHRLDSFLLRTGWFLLRYGMAALRHDLPAGQYDYPDWLFYGGSGPAPIQPILKEALLRWLGGAEEVIHLDFHTGLGKWATYKLLIAERPDSEPGRWWNDHFGAGNVESVQTAQTAYVTRGDFGVWCQSLIPGCRYRYATAEFGTYGVLRVVSTLVAENRAHWCGPEEPRFEWVRRRMVETFCPANPRWREAVVRQGIELVERSLGIVV